MKPAPFIKIIFSFLFLDIFSWFFCKTAFAFSDYTLETPLIQNQETVSSLGQYIKMLFMFGLGMIGIVALFSVVWGGINYLTAGSSETRKLEGKRWIYAAFSGTILLLFSYLIFITINPELTLLKEPNLNQQAQTGTQTSPFQLEMPLGNNQSPQTPGEYVKTFFIFGLGLAGIAALFAIVFGGVQYLLSAGNAALKTYGRQWIFAGLSGLFLLLCSYLILITINPQLVSLTLPPLNSFAPTTQGGSFQLEMPLSGAGQSPADFTQYIKSFFIFAFSLAGVVALFAVIFGGLNYIFSGSSQTRAMEGRRWITAAISGLALLLLSFLILNTINPELVSLKTPDLNQQAQTGTSVSPFQLEMPLGSNQYPQTPGEYVKLFFLYGLGIVGVAALFGIIFGGLNYIFSGSSQTRATEGKQWIFAAISGIALLLCSFLILITINPALISLKDPELPQITIPPHIGLGFNLSVGEIQASTGQWSDLANKWGSAKNIPPALIQAIIGRESGGKSSITSTDGGRGLMQITSSSLYRKYNLFDPNNPDENVRVGTSYLNDLRNYFNGDMTKAIAAYNCGTGGVEKAVAKGGDNWIAFLPKGVNKAGVPYDTRAYTEKVVSTWKSIEKK